MSFAISIIVAFIGIPYLIIRFCYESSAKKRNIKHNKISKCYREKLLNINDIDLEKNIERQLFENRYSYSHDVSEESIMANDLEILRHDKIINLVKKTTDKHICYEWKQNYSDEDMLRLILAVEGKVKYSDLFSGFKTPDDKYTNAIFEYMKRKHDDIKLIKIKNEFSSNEYLYAWIFGDIEHSKYNEIKYSAEYYC